MVSARKAEKFWQDGTLNPSHTQSDSFFQGFGFEFLIRARPYLVGYARSETAPRAPCLMKGETKSIPWQIVLSPIEFVCLVLFESTSQPCLFGRLEYPVRFASLLF